MSPGSPTSTPPDPEARAVGGRGRLGQVTQALYLDNLAGQMTRALTARGIRALLLKGPSFTDLLYERGEVRWYSDVDLLVSPDDLVAAGEVLNERGFHDPFARAAASETSGYAKELRGLGTSIDLHYSLPGITVSDAEAWRLLTDSTSWIQLGPVPVEVLGTEGRLVHVVLNAASDGPRKPKGLEDVARACRLPVERWEAAAALAARLGALPSLAAGLRLVPEGRELAERLVLPTEIPTGVALKAMSAPRLASGFDLLVTTPGFRGRAAFLLRRLVPTPSGLRYWSALAQRGWIGLVLAYLWRPVYLVIHAAPALWAWYRVRRRAPPPRTERRSSGGRC